jgi:hypothetical protein
MMFTATYWRQVLERVVVGAAAGGLSALAVGLQVTDAASWADLGSGVVVGGLTALLASLAGRAGGDPDSPLLTAPDDSKDGWE